MDGDQSIALNVVTAVADYEGIKPEEVQPPLHSEIDPEALDALFQSAGTDVDSVSVEFAYNGYTIRVSGPDEITIEEPARETEPRKEAV